MAQPTDFAPGRKFVVVPPEHDPETRVGTRKDLETKLKAVLTAEIDRLYAKHVEETSAPMVLQDVQKLMLLNEALLGWPQSAPDEELKELARQLLDGTDEGE